ncbi:Branched-chain alpha-keto acid dehydrogenase subunit E2 [Novosphingobium resinovorum]|uniref:Dihydrolipoamide acetyltransferase component of pyruvate dehydrogenase complex n=1 Tax=Novosphingobium resinovorum TaxID=158500 RepID=A0A031JRD9_9SPHN|nr:dihydrolipoamide acetyltransferase family protein [Novosphingobium resinovorum]EZP79343.1 Branched-chain alpha-keto acid dehydrogenase subunit E2 [Novosphingobium resinovorum]
MALYSFKLPDIGEGIAAAEIVGWHVKVGDRIEEDDPIADMMTDKATVEMTAPVSGVLVRAAGDVGDQVAIGAVLAVFEIDSADEVDVPEAGAAAPVPEYALQSQKEATPPPAPSLPAPPPPADTVQRKRIWASPAVRDRARALAIDLADVKPDTDGRIRHRDLDTFLAYNAASGYGTAATSASADETIRVIGLRRRIAENMAASKRHIPHFSYVEEIDVTKLEALRADLNAERGQRPKLSVLPLLVVAICRAIPQFPMMNALYDDEAGIVTRKGAVHLGIATQTDAGLMVPVVRNAQALNIWQLTQEIARLAEAARSGKAKPEELSGSTLTLTSLGALGGIATTPVINRPEVAILGPNKIVERPVVRDGRVAIAQIMNLSISCDHRVVDGWDAARFVQELKRFLETPALLFAF